MSYRHLTVEPMPDTDGRVSLVTLNRPDVANALNYDLLEEIERVAQAYREDAETRVVIVTGAGYRCVSWIPTK